MIPVTLLDVHVSTLLPLDMGANPGSSLRGAFYEALRTMYDNGQAVKSRYDADDNPIAWLLRLEDCETSGGKDVPRPIALRPPLTDPSRDMTFGVTLIGRGRDYADYVLSAFHAMQTIGLGRRRGGFTLERVDIVDPLTYQATPFLDRTGRRLTTDREPPSGAAYERMAQALAADQLAVRFLTPTRIIQDKHLCRQPLFRPWFQRLLERIRLLSELYTAAPVWIPFRDLLAVADGVGIVQDNTRWVEAWSGSRRDGELRPTSGFVGEVTYRGDFTALLPWLLLGQALQVGKNTIKGCGWYRLVYHWR